MAPLARQTWAEIATEVTARVGGQDYGGFSTRVQYAIDAYYRELCGIYHHFELETSSTAVVATNDISIPVPATAYIIMGVYRPSTATLGNMLNLKSMAALTGQFSSTASTPDSYSRVGSLLYLNCPVIVGAAGTYTIRFYSTPTAPDFSSGSPATGRMFDETIIQGATAKLLGMVWRPDLQVMGLQTMQQWLAQQPQPDIASHLLHETPDLPLANRPLGGAQG